MSGSIRIVKLQRSLSNPADGWLVYDAQRQHGQVLEHVPAPVRIAMVGRDKGHFAAIRVDDRWVLGERVRDEAW